jgi:protein-disulfide isomerase
MSIARAALASVLFAATAAWAGAPNIRGPEDAAVTLVVFSAFSCPYCAEGAKQLAELERKYPGKIRVIFKHYPLSLSAQGLLAHEAAIAAGEQGRFWEMHDRLFAAKREPSMAELAEIARQAGLDVARFNAALASQAGRRDVERDVAESKAYNVRATPTYYIEGFRLEGLQNASVFESIIEHRAAKPGAPLAASLPPAR